MEFTKMHGIGNDFIIIDGFRQACNSPEILAERLCRRRFGIGADGLILILPSQVADARMRIFNADGREPEMCGNGIRCLGKFLYDTGIVRKSPMTIETLAGQRTLTFEIDSEQVKAVTVNMGSPKFSPARIPLASEENPIAIALDGRKIPFFGVSMGNPHAVTYDCWPDDEAFYRLAPLIEGHPLFPQRANVEFCQIEPDGSIRVRVWERGDGETLACGTGACASLAAGVRLGLVNRAATVRLPGGDLFVEWAADGDIYMTGPAETVCHGSFDP